MSEYLKPLKVKTNFKELQFSYYIPLPTKKGKKYTGLKKCIPTIQMASEIRKTSCFATLNISVKFLWLYMHTHYG